MIELIKLSEKDKTVWNEFVLNHKAGNFFQTYDYFSLFRNDSKNRAFAYGLIDTNKILGIIVGVIESNLFPPLNRLTRRAIIRGGPLVLDDNPEILRTLISGFVKKMKDNCIYVQIRNLVSTKVNNYLFEESGFSYLPHLDILIDLKKDEQSITKDINHNKRGNVNKSINKGTIFRELESIEEVCTGVDLIRLTYKRVKLPVPETNFFINAYNLLSKKKILRVFGAFAENNLFGVRFELCFNGIIYDWYAGSDSNYKSRYPNDFLPYQILLWGTKNGFKLFDFGGAGKPGVPYGVREHKIKFGGELVEYGRYEKINQTILYTIGNIGLNIIRKM